MGLLKGQPCFHIVAECPFAVRLFSAGDNINVQAHSLNNLVSGFCEVYVCKTYCFSQSPDAGGRHCAA